MPTDLSNDLSRQHADEVQRGERFAFGRNWRSFLETLDDTRVDNAVKALREMLGIETLTGLRFLDIGSGSGLSSLAARCLGATVHSFDYDPECVACTNMLKDRFFPNDQQWIVEHASVLDAQYMESLEVFDVVYSWGVLHQTGDMWQAFEHVYSRVAPDGYLFISIYNDQGGASRRWRTIKRWYNKSPHLLQWLLCAAVFCYWELKAALIRLIRLQNPLPFDDWAQKKATRGMSVWHDVVDWVGGYPHEVAKPEEIFDFFRQHGFELRRLRTVMCGHGCNEYVFQRAA